MFEPERTRLDDLRLEMERLEFEIKRKTRMLHGDQVDLQKTGYLDGRIQQVKILLKDVDVSLSGIEEDIRDAEQRSESSQQRHDRWTTRRA